MNIEVTEAEKKLVEDFKAYKKDLKTFTEYATYGFKLAVGVLKQEDQDNDSSDVTKKIADALHFLEVASSKIDIYIYLKETLRLKYDDKMYSSDESPSCYPLTQKILMGCLCKFEREIYANMATLESLAKESGLTTYTFKRDITTIIEQYMNA